MRYVRVDILSQAAGIPSHIVVFPSSYHEENLLARHRLAAFGNGDGLELLELCQKIAHLIFLF